MGGGGGNMGVGGGVGGGMGGGGTTLVGGVGANIPTTKESDNSPKALAEKLDFIKTRVVDLQSIVQKAEESIMKERLERQRKQAALAAELARGKQ
ncbi:hypothetical protein HDU76_013121 [Blyttiomyces sp. JEL0837]|nr:hypothetical protein HDU76_013121 [Blyttiomyces sp. JEL0837]